MKALFESFNCVLKGFHKLRPEENPVKLWTTSVPRAPIVHKPRCEGMRLGF